MRRFLSTIFVCSLLVTPPVNAVFLGLDVQGKPADQQFTQLSRGKMGFATSLITTGVFTIYRSIANTAVRMSSKGHLVNSVILVLGGLSTGGGEPVHGETHRDLIDSCASVVGRFRDQHDRIDFSKTKYVQNWLNSEDNYFKDIFHNLMLKSHYKTGSSSDRDEPYIDSEKNDLIYQVYEDKNGNLIPKKIESSNRIFLKNKSKYIVMEKDLSAFFLTVNEDSRISICTYFKP